MPPELFFSGTTLPGREVRLFYEHVEFETFEDHAGETIQSPTRTNYTGTLDGVPITIDRLQHSSSADGSRTVTVACDQGTFTATNGADPTEHTAALRTFLEHRPSEGYACVVESAELVGGIWTFVVAVSNDHLMERVEWKMTEDVARNWNRDDSDRPTDDQVAADARHKLRNWKDVRKAVESPATITWRMPSA